LFDIERRLVASPGYVAAHPTPQSPEDLRHWDWIGLSMRQYRRTFRSPDNRPTEIEYEPRITVDSVEASCELAIAGLGLVTPAEFLIRAAIERGELVEVLPEWRVEPLGAFAVWPPNARRESLTYQFIEYLQTADAAGSD
jgi:DNA-binding transcriptional LysR family regulator